MQGTSDGQYFDAVPEEELLLLELLEELLLDDELEELLELLVEELLLDVEEELLLDELDELLEEVVPPQPINSNALIEARQIPRRVRVRVIGVSSGIVFLFQHPMPLSLQRQVLAFKNRERCEQNVKMIHFYLKSMSRKIMGNFRHTRNRKIAIFSACSGYTFSIFYKVKNNQFSKLKIIGHLKNQTPVRPTTACPVNILINPDPPGAHK